jgi:glycosyltransferase involved in cell wall biosynthesis
VAERERIRVVHHIWRLSETGGVPVVVRQLLTMLDPRRFEQHIVSHRPRFEEDDLDSLPSHVRVHSLDVVGSPAIPARAWTAVRLARLVASLRPDIVHTHSGIASNLLPWRMLNRVRTSVVLEVHDDAASGRVSRWTNAAESLAVRRLRYVPLAHSRAVADDVARRTGVDRAPVPLGIEVGALDRLDADGARWRSDHGISADQVVVLYVARLVPSKNVPLFLDVARVVASARPDTCFVLAGGGDVEGARLEAEARDLGHHVQVVGYEPDLVACYRAGDVFLSTSSYEGFGIALVEAMAAGLPVVSTRVGGADDVVVDGETGRLVELEDTKGLVAAVIALVDDADLRRAWGDAGRQRARDEFDVRRFVDDVAALYEHLATDRVRA